MSSILKGKSDNVTLRPSLTKALDKEQCLLNVYFTSNARLRV